MKRTNRARGTRLLQWGQFAANLYCELSVERGGLAGQGEFYRAPVGLCGTLFEGVCDNVYASAYDVP